MEIVLADIVPPGVRRKREEVQMVARDFEAALERSQRIADVVVVVQVAEIIFIGGRGVGRSRSRYTGDTAGERYQGLTSGHGLIVPDTFLPRLHWRAWRTLTTLSAIP